MTLCLFIRKSCVCTRWQKWRPIYILFSHSPTIIDDKYFRWKWTHFRKIYKGRLSFFWSWWHFLDTGRLTKILEGTLLWHAVPWSLDICSTQRIPAHRVQTHDASQEEHGSGVTVSAPVLDVSTPACTNGVWPPLWRRRTNRRPCCPPMSNPSTFPWTAWPDGSGRWDNRMTSQHLPRDPVRPSSSFNNWLNRRRITKLLK